MEADLTEFKESFERDTAEYLIEDLLEEKRLKKRAIEMDRFVNRLILMKSTPKEFLKFYLEVLKKSPIQTIDESFTKKTIEWNLTKKD